MTPGTDVILDTQRNWDCIILDLELEVQQICIYVICLTWMVWDLEIELPKIPNTSVENFDGLQKGKPFKMTNQFKFRNTFEYEARNHLGLKKCDA